MKNFGFWAGYLSLALCATAVLAQPDPYLTKRYLELNATPEQLRLRALCPLPVSVVYYQQQDQRTLAQIRPVFEQIKALGFSGLKQIQIKDPAAPKNYEAQVANLALDVGISPFYYGIGGWRPITDSLVRALKIDKKQSLQAIQADPKMQAWQTARLRERIARAPSIPPLPKNLQMGEPGRGAPWLPERLLPGFVGWLKEKYPTPDSLKRAWNVGWAGADFDSYDAAAKRMAGTGFDEFGRGTGLLDWDFRRYRDALRYQADLTTGDYARALAYYHTYEPYEPRRLGGHQLLENQALNGWDMEASGRAAAAGGSFYASIHLAHHFFLADNEVLLPAYLQARLIADNCKGGWPAVWESTGGPTQWSGYESFTVDSALITRLMCSYLAAGLKGIGFWTYNSRGAGWEGGEYALTDVSGKPSPRAKAAGAFAKALEKWRVELWQAQDEPEVGILYSWENEATLARISLGSYPLKTRAYNQDRSPQLAQHYSEARIGVARALLNNNVSFEICSEHDLEAGLSARYRTIYLPSMVTLPEATLLRLKEYVKEGGHLVVEMPCFQFDAFGRLNKWQPGSTTARLLGARIMDYQHTHNHPLVLDGDTIKGFYADLVLDEAKVMSRFADGNPAVTTHTLSKGSVTLLNYEAARQCTRPGHAARELRLAAYTRTADKPAFIADGGANVLRRAAPDADHYFLLNPTQKDLTVSISPSAKYTTWADAVTGEKIDIAGDHHVDIKLSPGSGRWLRAGR